MEKANKVDLLNEVARKQNTLRDEIRTARKQAEAEDLLAEKKAKENGIDFERKQLLKYTAEEVEDWGLRRAKKAKVADRGFADWEEANLRKHKKLINKIKPDLEEYEEMKEYLGTTDLYRSADSLTYGSLVDNKPPTEAIQKMSQDVQEQ